VRTGGGDEGWKGGVSVSEGGRRRADAVQKLLNVIRLRHVAAKQKRGIRKTGTAEGWNRGVRGCRTSLPKRRRIDFTWGRRSRREKHAGMSFELAYVPARIRGLRRLPRSPLRPRERRRGSATSY